MPRMRRHQLIPVTALALGLTACARVNGLVFGVDVGPVDLPIAEQLPDRTPDAKTEAIVASADAFLASLDQSQRAAAMHAFTDNAQRAKWSNFPEGMIPRGGLPLGELSEGQRALLDALLAELLSDEGVRNVELQLLGEDLLRQVPVMKYGTDLFYVAFLGEPSGAQPWMFMFGGHHLAINATVYGAEVTFSPMLTGGQPLHVPYRGEEVFVTEAETTAAKALLDSLTPEQKATAIRGDKPMEFLLGPGEFGAVLADEGVRGGDLDPAQRDLLVALIDARIGFFNDDDRAPVREAVLAGLDDTWFAWWGPEEPLGSAYFRVTGPNLVLEYAPRGGGERVDHAHAIYRDPENDYGRAWVEVRR